MNKKVFLSFLLLLTISLAFSLDLVINAEDIRIEGDSAAGIHVYIRKKGDIQSVLVTETTRDPEGKADNYALRDLSQNAVNGRELRILDGKPLTSKNAQYSIIDSTFEKDDQFGEALHLYLPPVMVYGYPWSRSGEIKLEKGLFLNLRAYEKPFADYSGAYEDNPFLLDINVINSKKSPELLENFNQTTVETFSSLAQATTGKIAFSKNPDDLLGKIRQILEPDGIAKKIDLIFAIDATISMKDDIEKLRKELIPLALEMLPRYETCRLGLLLYKDYNDDFLYEGLPIKLFPFTDNLDVFKKNLESFRVSGGGDYPEAVYEALYGSLTFYEWDREAKHRIILIGDAEPHHKPKGNGKYTQSLVESIAAEKSVQIDTIILFDPDRK